METRKLTNSMRSKFNACHRAYNFDVCTGCASLDDVTLFRKAETANEEL